jgi:hypothetical protein
MVFRQLSALLLLSAIAFAQSDSSRGHDVASQSPAQEPRVVQTAMKNVMYHFTDRIAVHIAQLQGYLRPTNSSGIVSFDEKNSFVLHVTSAEIAIRCGVLAQALNDYVLSAKDAPIKALTIASNNQQLIIKGKLHQKGDVSFEATGTLSVDGNGRVRVHTDHLKAAHVPLKGLLDLLGIDLSRLISTNQVRGVGVEKDDLLLDPEQIFPPPTFKGRITGVRLEGGKIIEVFGERQKSDFAAKQHGNYMAYRDGDLRFGKLTMNDADLILIDMDPRDPFDFYWDHYKEQIAAGYTKTTLSSGLRVYTRDYDKLHRLPAGRSSR